jgi:hypothetical protein
MNLPVVLFRLVQAVFPMSLPLNWDRFLTAPMRRLSPVGLLLAILLLHPQRTKLRHPVKDTEPRIFVFGHGDFSVGRLPVSACFAGLVHVEATRWNHLGSA